jgi:hypothetical protein
MMQRRRAAVGERDRGLDSGPGRTVVDPAASASTMAGGIERAVGRALMRVTRSITVP